MDPWTLIRASQRNFNSTLGNVDYGPMALRRRNRLPAPAAARSRSHWAPGALACCVAASLSVATPASEFTPRDTLPRNRLPHLNFVTLVVSDFDRALAFYTQVLPLRERGRAMPDADQFEVVLGFDNQPLTPGISLTVRRQQPAVRGSGASSINLVVRDLAGILARVPGGGGRILMPLQRGRSAKADYSLARIADPDGNTLELVEYHRLWR